MSLPETFTHKLVIADVPVTFPFATTQTPSCGATITYYAKRTHPNTWLPDWMSLDVDGQKLTFTADSPDLNGTYVIVLLASLLDSSNINELINDDSTIIS